MTCKEKEIHLKKTEALALIKDVKISVYQRRTSKAKKPRRANRTKQQERGESPDKTDRDEGADGDLLG